MLQDLSAATKSVNDLLTAMRSAGWVAVVAFALVLTFLVIKPILARQRKATQEVNLTIPTIPGNGTNGSGKTCPLHSGVEAQLQRSADYRQENKEEHERIFTKLDGLVGAVTNASLAAGQAAQAAADAAKAAAQATYGQMKTGRKI